MAPPRGRLAVALVAIVLVAAPGHTRHAGAQATCDPAEVTELRAHLVDQSRSAERWNLAWRLIFSGAAIGAGVIAAFDPWPKLREGLIASSGKATIGAAARWIMPLRIRVPAPSDGETCVELAALRKEVARVARKERQLFIMGHIGGIAVNLAGAAYVWYRDSFTNAMLSIAGGYPVGVLSNYTMPRGTWKLHRHRAPSWTTSVALVPHPDRTGWSLSIAGTF